MDLADAFWVLTRQPHLLWRRELAAFGHSRLGRSLQYRGCGALATKQEKPCAGRSFFSLEGQIRSIERMDAAEQSTLQAVALGATQRFCSTCFHAIMTAVDVPLGDV